MKTTRKLAVKLSDAEVEATRHAHSVASAMLQDIEAEQKDASAAFRDRKKPIKQEQDRLKAILDQGAEIRDVECEERESLVNGQIEVIRLDTGEVVETFTPGGPDETEPSNQPGLPFARPDAPRLLCTAMNDDGEVWPITAEQADAADREITETGSARVQVEGDTHTVTRILRGRACDTCGIVAPHHRPECASMLADAEADPESYDPNDTAAVAARIAEIEPPPDGPVRGVESATTKVKPKRGKRGAQASEVH